MSISGHKTRSVFDRYHIVSTENVLDAMQKVVTASLTRNGSNGERKPKTLSEVRKPVQSVPLNRAIERLSK
jgi:hypothetical protein